MSPWWWAGIVPALALDGLFLRTWLGPVSGEGFARGLAEALAMMALAALSALALALLGGWWAWRRPPAGRRLGPAILAASLAPAPLVVGFLILTNQ